MKLHRELTAEEREELTEYLRTAEALYKARNETQARQIELMTARLKAHGELLSLRERADGTDRKEAAQLVNIASRIDLLDASISKATLAMESAVGEMAKWTIRTFRTICAIGKGMSQARAAEIAKKIRPEYRSAVMAEDTAQHTDTVQEIEFFFRLTRPPYDRPGAWAEGLTKSQMGIQIKNAIKLLQGDDIVPDFEEPIAERRASEVSEAAA